MAERTSYLERQRVRIGERGPLCLGIDPSSALLERWGRDDDPGGLEFLALEVLEVAFDAAVAIKPQVAFFERFGSVGYRVLERLIADARAGDLLVVADAKRGDVATTNAGYAAAWLEDASSLCVDALTLHPYLGLTALEPFVEVAERTGRGLFVVVASSNPEGRLVQGARTAEGESVETHLLRAIAEWNGRSALPGSIGAVLGATRDAPSVDLAALGGAYLVPGVGAQGAGANDVARLFARCAPGTVLVNVARDVLSRGPERRALRDAARRWRDDLVAAL